MMKLLTKIPKPVIYLLGVILAVVITYYGWQFKRWVHYSWSYETQVTQTVCKMVKPEYLKNPSDCE